MVTGSELLYDYEWSIDAYRENGRKEENVPRIILRAPKRDRLFPQVFAIIMYTGGDFRVENNAFNFVRLSSPNSNQAEVSKPQLVCGSNSRDQGR